MDAHSVPPPGKPVLLFLIADTGGGHRASAAAVQAEFEMDHPGVFEIRIVDPFALSTFGPTAGAANLYGPLSRHAGWLWGAVYRTTNSRAAVALMQHTVLRSVGETIAGVCKSVDPTVVVSFHPLLNHVTAAVLQRPDVRRVPFCTVVTDLADIHSGWLAPQADAVVVPSQAAVARALSLGVNPERVHDFGLPVHPAFTQPPLSADARIQLRHKLGVAHDRPLVLLCGGGDGSGGLARRARALAASGLPVNVAVICGHNETARRELEGLTDAHGAPVLVMGFADNMDQWLRAADVVVTKAGPGTIAQALCTGTPVLLSSYLPGQERANVGWVVRTGGGRYVPRVRQLVRAVAGLTDAKSGALATLRSAANRAARPHATKQIVGLISRLGHPPRAGLGD